MQTIVNVCTYMYKCELNNDNNKVKKTIKKDNEI